jgi:hypothetical protein
VNLKNIEYIQQLEKENKKLKERVDQLENLMYAEDIASGLDEYEEELYNEYWKDR